MSAGKHAGYRRLSQWRIGPKQKPRVFYAHQERSAVRRAGDVQLVCSTTKPHLKTATPDDVKILMTNATGMSLTDVIELDSPRWQIELFFKELKSTLGFHQYRFQDFAAVRAWAEIALTTVLFLEYERAQHPTDRRVPPDARRWWQRQRLHDLCSGFRQASAHRERKYLADRLKSAGGIQKLKRLLTAALPNEYRTPA